MPVVPKAKYISVMFWCFSYPRDIFSVLLWGTMFKLTRLIPASSEICRVEINKKTRDVLELRGRGIPGLEPAYEMRFFAPRGPPLAVKAAQQVYPRCFEHVCSYQRNATFLAATAVSRVFSFTSDDYVALAFLVGLGVSTLRNCIAAFIGCLISSVVVIVAIGNLIAHYFECNKTRNKARELLQVHVDPRDPKEKAKPSVRI